MPPPLPMLVPESEFFWTSGSEGVLRFRRCADCRSFQHPPGPICRSCGSSDLAPEDVSGRGVLVVFTVNEHLWSPAMPPPYVIGIVAIDEDPRIRLTTNIVDVPLADLAVGRRVEVRFNQVEDVWLPLFTYAGDGPPEGPVPEDERPERWIRPMLTPDKFEDKVAITGIGMSRIGRRLGVDPLSLAIEAARQAVNDAGLTMADIDGLATYPGGGGAGGHSEGGVTALEESLRIRPTWFNGSGETPGHGGSVVAAMLAVAAGLCRHVLCFRTVWESTWTERACSRPPSPASSSEARVEGVISQWRAPFGALSAANLGGPLCVQSLSSLRHHP